MNEKRQVGDWFIKGFRVLVCLPLLEAEWYTAAHSANKCRMAEVAIKR